MAYYIGDRVKVRINSTSDVIFDISFDDERYKKFHTATYEIIGHFDGLWILLVPYYIEESFYISDTVCDAYGIKHKFVNLYGYFIKERSLGARENPKPVMCCCCKQWHDYAVANQEDGRFACWSCRTDERYKVIYGIK